MKTLLTLFVLFFSSSVYADDISDFQIEGISIGDSALDFFSEKHIKRNEQDYYKDKKFTLVENVKLSFEYTNYDIVNFNYKTDDKNYIIHNISGKIDYDNNIDECLIKMDEIINDLKQIFKNAKFYDKETYSHSGDPTGKSKVTDVVFELKSGDVVVQCYDWSDEFDFIDNLSVALDSREFFNWMSKGVY